MNPSTFREFFYYDPALPNAPHDFTDPTVLSKKERLEFLTKYAEFLEKSYGLPENPVPVVTEEASEKAAGTFTLSFSQDQCIWSVMMEAKDGKTTVINPHLYEKAKKFSMMIEGWNKEAD